MRRSRLIALGYVVAGVLFIVNAVSGAATDAEQRAVTWGVLGTILILFSIYPVLDPGQFDDGIETKTTTENEAAIGYDVMFTVVLVVVLVLGSGVLFKLFL
jgi:hypothetical protein